MSAKDSTVRVAPVEREDLSRCAEIMDSAFGTEDDPVGAQMYPKSKHRPEMSNAERYRGRGRSMEKHYLDAPGMIMMKSIDADSGKITGIAIWAKPGTPILSSETDAANGNQDDEDDPEVDLAFIHRFQRSLQESRRKHIGNTPHWYLKFLAIDASEQGKGIGSVLLRWGMDEADKSSPPVPVVLEASPAGQPLYEKRGFQAQADVHVEGVPPFPIMLRKAAST